MVSQAFKLGKNNNKTYEVLVNMFQTMRLIEENKRNSGLYSAEISSSIKNKMQPKPAPVQPRTVFIDPKATYPINKPGAVGTL